MESVVPIVPKGAVLTHPERRILRVKRPNPRQKNDMYQKDEVDELAEHWSFSTSAQIYRKPSNRATPRGVCTAAAENPGGEAYLCEVRERR